MQEIQETQVPSLDPANLLEKAMATTPVFLPGNFMDIGAWWATVHGVTNMDVTEHTLTHTHTYTHTHLPT